MVCADRPGSTPRPKNVSQFHIASCALARPNPDFLLVAIPLSFSSLPLQIIQSFTHLSGSSRPSDAPRRTDHVHGPSAIVPHSTHNDHAPHPTLLTSTLPPTMPSPPNTLSPRHQPMLPACYKAPSSPSPDQASSSLPAAHSNRTPPQQRASRLPRPPPNTITTLSWYTRTRRLCVLWSETRGGSELVTGSGLGLGGGGGGWGPAPHCGKRVWLLVG